MEEDPLAMPPSTAAALVVHASYLSAKIKVRALCLPTLPSARARASTPLLPCPPTPSDGHVRVRWHSHPRPHQLQAAKACGLAHGGRHPHTCQFRCDAWKGVCIHTCQFRCDAWKGFVYTHMRRGMRWCLKGKRMHACMHADNTCAHTRARMRACLCRTWCSASGRSSASRPPGGHLAGTRPQTSCRTPTPKPARAGWAAARACSASCARPCPAVSALTAPTSRRRAATACSCLRQPCPGAPTPSQAPYDATHCRGFSQCAAGACMPSKHLSATADASLLPLSDVSLLPLSDASLLPLSDASLHPLPDASLLPLSDASLLPPSDASPHPLPDASL